MQITYGRWVESPPGCSGRKADSCPACRMSAHTRMVSRWFCARPGGGPQQGRATARPGCRVAAAGAAVSDSRADVLWGLVAAQAASRGGRVSVADVCTVAARLAAADGGWATASSGQGPDFVMSVTGPLSEQLAELQLTLGEGPCHDVLASAAPVLAADLGDEASGRRWPGFAPEARRAGAGAVFAFPLIIGAIRVGVMGLYRAASGPLGPRFGDCLILADAATVLLLDSAGDGKAADGAGAGLDGAGLDGHGPEVDGRPPDLALHRAEIDQATGMLTVQLGVTPAEAFVRLRAYAYAHDRRLAEVAGDILARRLRLHPAGQEDEP